MALTLSNAVSQQIVASIGNIFTDGWMLIRDASNATLVKSRLPLQAFAANTTPGRMDLSGVWYGSAIANGTANNFLMTNYANTVSISGSVSNTSGSGDIKLSNTTIVFGQLVEVSNGYLTFV